MRLPAGEKQLGDAIEQFAPLKEKSNATQDNWDAAACLQSRDEEQRREGQVEKKVIRDRVGWSFPDGGEDGVPMVVADNPVGEWNTFHIVMDGELVTVRLNDQLVVDDVRLENYWDRSIPIYPSGPIELQNHGNTLYFRNIWIRER